MNILHTSDWHIGKRLMDTERLAEQREVLDEIISVCNEEQVDVVLVAGDIFDTYLPSAEAEELYFNAVKRLSEQGRAVVLVSGNHDDAVRLAASAPIASSEGIYVFGNKPTVFPQNNRRVHVKESGENYLVLENERGEQLYINALPYPNEARLREEKTEETYAQKTSRWIKKGDSGYRGDIPHVLLSHIFVAGSSVSEGERNIDLGGARAVPADVLPKEGYVALGHLHKKQRVGANGRYSGSILQYSFDEANTEKSVVLLKTEGSSITVAKEIPLTSGKTLARLEAQGLENALKLLNDYQNHYVELTLHLTAPLTAQETQTLKECNEGLVSLIARVNTQESEVMPVRSNLSAEELFYEFYQSRFGEEPPKELSAAFLSLLSEEV